MLLFSCCWKNMAVLLNNVSVSLTRQSWHEEVSCDSELLSVSKKNTHHDC